MLTQKSVDEAWGATPRWFYLRRAGFLISFRNQELDTMATREKFPPGITIIGRMDEADGRQEMDYRNYRIMRFKNGIPVIDWASTAMDAVESFESHPLPTDDLLIVLTCLQGNVKEIKFNELLEMAKYAHFVDAKRNPVMATTATVLTVASLSIDLTKRIWPLVEKALKGRTDKYLGMSSDEQIKFVRKISWLSPPLRAAFVNDQLVASVAQHLNTMAKEKTLSKAVSGTIEASETTRDMAETGMHAYNTLRRLKV